MAPALPACSAPRRRRATEVGARLVGVTGSLETVGLGPSQAWPAREPDPVEARYLARAIALARRAAGRTSPTRRSARSWCARAHRRRGYHRRAGEPHAEVVALRQAGEAARGATLYVTLEPCAHWGRTPPCADALIQAGVRRVVACTLDPNPRVDGRGFARLAAAGVEVVLARGELRRRVRQLNAGYEKHVTTGLPYVTVKVAMSLDGKIATASGDARWISSEASRALVHRLRARHDAVMVGVGTVLADDPLLTARPGGRARARQPLRVVVDSTARTPLASRLVTSAGPTAPVLVATTPRAPAQRLERLRERGIEVRVLPQTADGRVDLGTLMAELGRRDVLDVLVEGGGTLAGSLVASGMADRLLVFVAPVILGGVTAPTPVGGAGVARIADAWRVARWSVRAVRGSGSPPDLLIEALFDEAVRRLERP
ncbi:bifunctional diaminohydroxyphosphoribosylaminopyrimidine deaminase/5-amino-6-(5-phosphoribosylamino)uracil reductase RibD [Geochorda subterranea]|uniref:Riboflavin biosynthesis protein RibD n=1 Tax=Geochorda subterranea TaxID=3109564 RepID=A0ABZ1BNX4_9FIRM|nr:bifunctional diaminohydroxyphosphoribosylaminopyrimidine deaminase/5-amino-6-(5-phosphoribosylamino)uracil reductase RibD [Limnochorda sp. LNt]WRP14180.1 bifunctional diaminohydroxyphosphoribosylaminopyrimidine deaminase/5-amino-6-(5-phosphoribosylamino)uracil reductase RibD [Limnochorda sp. LNt]